MTELINHPAHYQNKAGYEVLDVLADLSLEPATCLSDSLQYLLRYHKKGGILDIKKARWYLARFVKKDLLFIAPYTPNVYGLQIVDDFEITDYNVRLAIISVLNYFKEYKMEEIKTAVKCLDMFIIENAKG